MLNATISAAGKAVPAETRSILEAIDLLCRAISLNELIFMAGESIAISNAREAITTGVDMVDGVLTEVKAILCANIKCDGYR